jgi:protein ImuB
MSRFLTIWLPRYPVQRRLVERPELRRVPVFVCRSERRGAMTVVSWAWAEPPRCEGSRRGARGEIPPGMSLAEAMAVLARVHGERACRVAEVEHDDPTADRESLERLARWCRRFSPTVGIESAPVPECLHLDVTGTAGFFGGEERLAKTVVWTLAARGLHARAAIADTPAAARAAAHHTDALAPPGADGTTVAVLPLRQAGGVRRTAVRRRRRWAVVPKGAAAALLESLPVAALGLDEATIAVLREVGVDSIGGVLTLSGRSLASRFPPLLSRRLAEFRGTVAEPALAPGGESLPQASHAFDFPVPRADLDERLLVGVIEPLVDRCLAPLVGRGEGVLALQVRLEHASLSVSSAPTVIDVGLFRPSASRAHLVELVRLRLARIRPPAELVGVAVEVVAAGAVPCRQRLLFGAAGLQSASADTEHGDADTEVGMLLDRLSGRLGRAAVFEPQTAGDAQPEHAWIAAPPRCRPAGMSPAKRSSMAGPAADDRGLRRRERGPAPRPVPAGRRPIWMPPRPLPLDDDAVVSVSPDGPPSLFRFDGRMHRVVQARGPERIETAWWRGPTVRRDYYVVETEAGARFWLFRRLRDGGWFLHGMFA